MKISKTAQKTSVTFNTNGGKKASQMSKWWLAKDDAQLAAQLVESADYLKQNQQYRYRQAALYARLYGNVSLYNFAGSNMLKTEQANGIPVDRPTFNLIQSATDTLVSKIGQNRPQPTFLTDNGDYKQRNLAKKLNNFILGEFYQTKAYEKGVLALRDSLVEGTGCIKIYESEDAKVCLERVMLTELDTDANDGIYGDPRQLFQRKLIDRDVLFEMFPRLKKKIEVAAKAFPDSSADSSKTVSDQVMVVEGWHLPSGKNAKDGRHAIACSAGVLLDEEYTKPKFPFIFLHYSPRLLGFWAQGLAEQLMGTQLEINSLLYTISKAIKLVGVPRVFVEDGSKVVKAHLNNEIGTIITYKGTKPSYEVAQCVPQELYAQLQRLIDYGYSQCGVSALQAASQKPAGLNSGEAIRSYDDIATDRFATLSRRYDDFFVELAYAVIDLAKDIAERDGKYQTVYPSKDGTKEVDLPKADLLKDTYVIQCFNMSSLPRDPAGRFQKVTEMVQSGMITLKEGRRLLDYPDLEQIETLANASEERIFQILDEIIEDGKYTPPDPFMDLELAKELSTQYINLYSQAKLEEAKAEMLRNFFTQAKQMADMAAASMAPPPGAMPTPQASPEPLPTSPLIPNAPQVA